MKKLICFLLCICLSVCMLGCSSQKEEAILKPATLGTKIFAEFQKELGNSKDLMEIANVLASPDISGLDCAIQEYQEGYLNGFSTEITGFTKAVGFMPWISSIPFVCYIFETNQPEELKKSLQVNADPRWNICTEADETLIEIVDNYVFFIMCSNEEENNQ